jgi:cytoskeletal protein CcmA (bactofilin family)
MSERLSEDEITALLGRGTRFEGKLHFEGCVRIEGSFSGEVLSDDTLVIGEGAAVDGDILAGTVIIRGGDVRANVRATRTIELMANAVVSGNLRAPEVYIDKGARFSGGCTMGPVASEEGNGPEDPEQHPENAGVRRAENES